MFEQEPANKPAADHYDRVKEELRQEAAFYGETEGETFRRRAAEISLSTGLEYRVVSTGEESVGPIRRKLGDALIWLLSRDKG